MPATAPSAPASSARGDVGALGDPAGEQQRVAGGQRRAHPLEQLQGRRRAAHVAAGLDPLDDHRVGAGRVGGRRLGDRAALVEPGPAGAALRRAPEGDDDVGGRRRLEPVAAGEGQQQVDGERPAGQRPRGASSRSIAAAPLTAIVPSPPASETAAASSWRLSPPPIPAWTTGVAAIAEASRGTATSDDLSSSKADVTREDAP